MQLPFSLLSVLGIGLAAAVPATRQAPASSGNSITLITLNQPPCKVLSGADVLTAKVAYRIADTEQSAEGFAVSIKFQGTDPRMTFSASRGRSDAGGQAVSLRADTLTLTYPMATIMRDARLRRPVTCYFYLHRNLGEGRSTVIARTPPIVFQECL